MTRVSSPVIVIWKYFGPFVLLVINVVLLTREEINYHALIAVNAGAGLILGFVSVYFFRLWDVDINGQAVIAKRFKKTITFTLSDIRTINITPNIIDDMPPFVNIILNKKRKGVFKIKYFPSSDRKDEELLIGPWKEVYREWAQESLKRRKARR
jgi:hypothetical protein